MLSGLVDDTQLYGKSTQNLVAKNFREATAPNDKCKRQMPSWPKDYTLEVGAVQKKILRYLLYKIRMFVHVVYCWPTFSL